MEITLNPNLEQIVQDKVNSGIYQNASEIISEALTHWFSTEESEELQLLKLKEAVAIGARQAERGEFVDQSMEEIIAEAQREKYGEDI